MRRPETGGEAALRLLHQLEPELFPSVGQYLERPSVVPDQDLERWFTQLDLDPRTLASDQPALDHASEQVAHALGDNNVGSFQYHEVRTAIAFSNRCLETGDHQIWIQVTSDGAHPLIFVRPGDSERGTFVYLDRLEEALPTLQSVGADPRKAAGSARKKSSARR